MNKVTNEAQKNYKERTNRFNQYNKFNTLKMIVDKKRPFNYKGKIDIIVEEGSDTGFLLSVRFSGKYALMKCRWGADTLIPRPGQNSLRMTVSTCSGMKIPMIGL